MVSSSSMGVADSEETDCVDSVDDGAMGANASADIPKRATADTDDLINMFRNDCKIPVICPCLREGLIVAVCM